MSHEGVASVLAQQVNILTNYGLACFNMRDSCISLAIHLSYNLRFKYGSCHTFFIF